MVASPPPTDPPLIEDVYESASPAESDRAVSEDEAVIVIDSEEGATVPPTEIESEPPSPSVPLAVLLSVDPAPSIVIDSDSGAVFPPTEIESPPVTCAD
jgi:hypothetical protein